MLRRLFSTVPRRSVALPKVHSLSKQSHQNSRKPLPSAQERFRKQGPNQGDAPKSPKQFSKYINELPESYNVQLVEKAILVVGNTLNAEESGKILSVLGQKGSGQVIAKTIVNDVCLTVCNNCHVHNFQDLKRIRSVLSGPGRGMVTFDQVHTSLAVTFPHTFQLSHAAKFLSGRTASSC